MTNGSSTALAVAVAIDHDESSAIPGSPQGTISGSDQASKYAMGRGSSASFSNGAPLTTSSRRAAFCVGLTGAGSLVTEPATVMSDREEREGTVDALAPVMRATPSTSESGGDAWPHTICGLTHTR